MKLFKHLTQITCLAGLLSFQAIPAYAATNKTLSIAPDPHLTDSLRSTLGRGALDAQFDEAQLLTANIAGPDNLGEEVTPSENQKSTDSIPLPAAVWLFGSAVIGLTFVARRRKPQPNNSAG